MSVLPKRGEFASTRSQVFSATPLRIGRVVLTVHDLPAVSRFYRDALGLHDLCEAGGTAKLGVGETILLELRRDTQARFRSPREAGLYHTAFLLPSRADLGRWFAHASQKRLAIQSAADHAVSEAIYLADPEGNGVEIYADRLPDTWHWDDGKVTLKSTPLDLDDLLRGAGTGSLDGFPGGSTIGHVHLQVGSIAPAEAFYEGVLGFPLTSRFSGASFFGSGNYHHHVATNIWNSRNAGVREQPSTGLADLEIVASETSTLAAVATRAAAAGIAVERQPSGLKLQDPWGTSITLTSSGI